MLSAAPVAAASSPPPTELVLVTGGPRCRTSLPSLLHILTRHETGVQDNCVSCGKPADRGVQSMLGNGWRSAATPATGPGDASTVLAPLGCNSADQDGPPWWCPAVATTLGSQPSAGTARSPAFDVSSRVRSTRGSLRV